MGGASGPDSSDVMHRGLSRGIAGLGVSMTGGMVSATALGAAAASEQSEEALQAEFQKVLDTLRGRGRAEVRHA